MSEQAVLKVNVASRSTEGHYVSKATKIINLDEVKEKFFIKGEATLTSAKHQTLPMEKDCFITPQRVYNPWLKKMEAVKD